MTITLDANTTHQYDSAAVTTRGFSHTVGTTGVNTVLFVLVGLRGTTLTAPNMTATYNSIAMTSLGERVNTSGTPDVAVACFYMVNPPTGTNTVTLSWTGNAYIAAIARSYHNVNLSAPIRSGSFTSTAYTGTGPSLSVASLNNDVVLDVLQFYTNGTTPAEGGGQTLIYQTQGGVGDNGEFATSYELATTTSTTMSWTTDSGQSAYAAFSIAPAGNLGGVVVSPFMSF